MKFRHTFYIAILTVIISFSIFGCKEDDEKSVLTSAADTTAPTVISISPADSSTDIAIDTSISVTFSEAMDESTLTTNTESDFCSGIIQLSMDEFSTCVIMSADPSSDTEKKVFVLTSNENLFQKTNYKLKILTGVVQDVAKNRMTNIYLTENGFLTQDTIAPTIVSTTPSDNESPILKPNNITVTFSEIIDVSTITVNTENTNCSGSLQVSSNNFLSCIQMSSVPSVSSDHKTFSITPIDAFSFGTTYKIRVTIGVKDSFGNTLESDYTSSAGFSIGTWIGTQQLGSLESEYTQRIASTNSGDIYIIGYTFGDLDENTNQGAFDIFFVKYNSYGVKQWTKLIGTSGDDIGSGIALDSSENIYITGSTSSNFEGYTNQGNQDIILLKYNSSGVKQWTKQIGTSGNERGESVIIDNSGNIYVTGWTQGGLDGNTNQGSEDIFLIKYNSSGVKQWTKQIGTSNQDFGHGVITDNSGNIYITGLTTGGLDGNTNQGGQDIFLLKYNSSGVKQWTQQIGTSGSDRGDELVVDSADNIFITGYTGGELDGNTHQGGLDVFLLKYISSGVKQWTKQIGSSEDEMGMGLAVDSSGSIYISGHTTGGLDGNTNQGGQDIFLIKYSSGVKQWTHQIGTSSDDRGEGVSTDVSGNIYVAGYTGGGLDGNTNQGGNDIIILKYNSSGEKQ